MEFRVLGNLRMKEVGQVEGGGSSAEQKSKEFDRQSDFKFGIRLLVTRDDFGVKTEVEEREAEARSKKSWT